MGKIILATPWKSPLTEPLGKNPYNAHGKWHTFFTFCGKTKGGVSLPP